MHNHFDKNLCLRDFILERRPKVIVECGCADGQLLRQIVGLYEFYDFKLYGINDSPYAEETIKLGHLNGRFQWIYDLSFRALKSFEDKSIGLCIIDTDHNYWTMREELNALEPKLSIGGMVAMHDTQTYRKNSGGYADRYGTNDPYDRKMMESVANGRGMGDAIWEFLMEHENYIVLRQVSESHGAMVLEKVNA